jgi:16S rRNA (guanine966-N2)-methyltransferase
MRIVAGTHRGRILKTPTGADIRPTSDKVRQAVFNALHSRGAVTDAIVLDAFCGTGALGLEALSQGAAAAIFTDISAASLALAKDNAALLREEQACTFLLKDAANPGPRPDTVAAATLLFLDPPYRKNLVPQSLKALQENGWLAPDCIVLAEAEKGDDLSALPGEILTEKNYGDTKVVILVV